MRKNLNFIIAAAFVSLSIVLLMLPAIGAGTFDNVVAFVNSIYDSSNSAMQISIVSTSSNSSIDGTLTVGGDVAIDTDVLAVDTTNDIVSTNGWNTFSVVTPAAASYTLNSTGKAGFVAYDYTTTGAASLILDTDLLTTPGAGSFFWVYDVDGNANTNNITISTEGSETINGAATYVMDADDESVMIVNNGTNYFVTGGFNE